MAARQKPARSGFTLIEMLVVITIIAILAGLIAAAATSALGSSRQTRIKVEVDSLATAIETMKQKYGAYPPAILYCPPDGNGTPAAMPELMAFVLKAFPKYGVVTSGYSLGNQIASDLINAGVNVVNFANPQVALVFWLSGVGPDETDPFNRANLPVTRSPFYGFDQTRLVSASDGTTAGAVSITGTIYAPGGITFSSATLTYGIGQLVYNAPYGNAAYCYFDYHSYGPYDVVYNMVHNYGHASANTTTATGLLPGTLFAMAGTPYAEQLVKSGTPIPMILSNGTGFVMPYVLDVNNNSTFDASDQYCNPMSFQIISAGQDGAFGTLVLPIKTTQGRLYPSGVNPNGDNPMATVAQLGFSYDPPSPNGGSADDDNVTNFCQKNNLASAKP